jgi:hypothetical protein
MWLLGFADEAQVSEVTYSVVALRPAGPFVAMANVAFDFSRLVWKRREIKVEGVVVGEGVKAGAWVAEWRTQQIFKMRVAGSRNRPPGVDADGPPKGPSYTHSATSQTPVENPRCHSASGDQERAEERGSTSAVVHSSEARSLLVHARPISLGIRPHSISLKLPEKRGAPDRETGNPAPCRSHSASLGCPLRHFSAPSATSASTTSN